MFVAYNVLLVVAFLMSVVIVAIVFFSKGDAMSGGSSIRTTFKGKASFEDKLSRYTLYFGLSFMALMLILDFLATRIFN